MNQLDRYVAAVGKHLPRRGRADIEAEIRSTLQDMLDERSARTGRPADGALLGEVLKEYGAPDKVAASYRPAQYLIGPRLFPTFWLVTRIVVGVLLAVSLVGLGISLASSAGAGNVLATLGKFALKLFSGSVAALGNIVLVFAILERVLPPSELSMGEEEAWDPAELTREPDPDAVEPAGQIASIIFTALGLAVLNLYPSLIRLWFVVDGRWVSVPVLSAPFFSYLPWINVLGLLQIALGLLVLREGCWKTYSRFADIALTVGGAVLAGFMLAGPSLVSIPAGQLAGTPLAAAGGELLRLLRHLPTLILAIVIVVSAVDVAQTVLRLFNRRSALSPAP